jgi:hypothetical protein
VGRVREGVRQRLADLFKDAVQLGEDLRIPESENPKALGFEPAGPSGIFRGDGGMLATVDFNYQLCLETDEVNDVRTDWDLTAKTKPLDLLTPKP